MSQRGEVKRKYKLKADPKIHTPCFTIDEELINAVKRKAQSLGQTPSAVVRASVHYYISLLKHEEIARKKALKEIYVSPQESIEVEKRDRYPTLFEVVW